MLFHDFLDHILCSYVGLRGLAFSYWYCIPFDYIVIECMIVTINKERHTMCYYMGWVQLFSLEIALPWYYGGLKFVPLGFKRLVIQQSVNKVKSNLQSCFTRVRFAKWKHDYKLNFTLWTDCRITNLLNLRGTNFSPP